MIRKSSSPAIAERRRDASCLSVAFIVQYVERKFRFRFTAAYNSNLFCSLLFVEVDHAGCDKQDHWCVAVCAVNCTIRGPLQLLFALHQSSIDSQLLVENRDFAYPTCIRRPRSRAPSKYCHDVCYGRTRMVWQPDGEKNFDDNFVPFDRVHERDRRTDKYRLTA